jgi:hypothetical protein
MLSKDKNVKNVMFLMGPVNPGLPTSIQHYVQNLAKF